MNNSKYLLVTIDTEGDNIWRGVDKISTQNAKYIPRFHSLCEKYHFRPTYLTNYEMASSKDFIKFLKLTLSNNTAEVGMHLHAWNSPPYYKLSDDDQKSMPFLIEYPFDVMCEKISFLTELLQDTFEVKMLSHRAGRWAFNERYAKIISKMGYKVDCSIIPHITLDRLIYYGGKKKIISYEKFRETPYLIDLDNIIKEDEDSSLLEIPLSSIIHEASFFSILRDINPINSFSVKIINRLTKNPHILRPNGQNLINMKRILRNAEINKWPCVSLMLHSSELMPGGSPYFPNSESIENLYADLEVLFAIAKNSFEGVTCKEFYDIYKMN